MLCCVWPKAYHVHIRSISHNQNMAEAKKQKALAKKPSTQRVAEAPQSSSQPATVTAGNVDAASGKLQLIAFITTISGICMGARRGRAFSRNFRELLVWLLTFYMQNCGDVWMYRIAWCKLTTLCLKKNIPDVFSYNSRKHWRIFIICGRNVTEKASNHMLLHFPTSPN